MARCEICGNDYDKSFTVTPARGAARTFDSFECAIHALAPTCSHCDQCRAIPRVAHRVMGLREAARLWQAVPRKSD